MPENNAGENYIALRDIPKLRWIPLRRRGSRLAYATLWRWATQGSAGVLLKTVCVGDQRCCTETWLRDFFAAVAVAKSSQSTLSSAANPSATIRTPAERQRSYERAQQELAVAGIK
jgi:hypothetical protein